MSLPAQIARTRRFSLGVPGQFAVGPDGAEVLFLRTRAGDDPVACLWALDLDSGTERLLEVLLLPGVGHQALSGEIAERLLWHQVRYLQRHLGEDRQP